MKTPPSLRRWFPVSVAALLTLCVAAATTAPGPVSAAPSAPELAASTAEAKGKSAKNMLGFQVKMVSGNDRHGPEKSEAPGASTPKIVVSKVHPKGPAAEAGIKKGDELTLVNGRAASSTVSIGQAFRNMKEGDKVPLTLSRDGKSISVTLTLGGNAKKHGKPDKAESEEPGRGARGGGRP